MSAKHTPGPWTNFDHREPTSAIFAGEDRDLIADARTVANAAFIVRACNSHDALLAALQAVEKRLAVSVEVHFTGYTGDKALLADVRAAIAKAVQS